MSLTRRSLLSAAVYGGLTHALRPRTYAQTHRSTFQRVLRSKPALGLHEPPVVTCLAIQSDGEWVAVGGDDHLLRIWNFRTGELVHELAGHRDWIRAVLFVPGTDEVITAGNDRRLLRWRFAEGGVAHRQLARHEQAIAALAINADGTRLAAIGFEPRLYQYSLETGEHLARFECPCRDMRAATFSPDGETLAAAGRNGRIRIWAVGNQKHVRDIKAHRGRIRALAFSPDGRHLASASEDRTARIWNMKTSAAEKTYSTDASKLLSATYLDDDRLAVGGSDNTIRVWKIATDEQVGVLRGHTGSVTAIVHDHDTLISGSFDTTVCIWRISGQTNGADRRFGEGNLLK